MADRRFEEKLRLLAARRDALAKLTDDLETLHSELTFFGCDTEVLLEQPAVAPVPELCAKNVALGARVGACDERVYELQQKVEAAISAAETVLAKPASAPDPMY